MSEDARETEALIGVGIIMASLLIMLILFEAKEWGII